MGRADLPIMASILVELFLPEVTSNPFSMTGVRDFNLPWDQALLALPCEAQIKRFSAQTLSLQVGWRRMSSLEPEQTALSSLARAPAATLMLLFLSRSSLQVSSSLLGCSTTVTTPFFSSLGGTAPSSEGIERGQSLLSCLRKAGPACQVLPTHRSSGCA